MNCSDNRLGAERLRILVKAGIKEGSKVANSNPNRLVEEGNLDSNVWYQNALKIRGLDFGCGCSRKSRCLRAGSSVKRRPQIAVSLPSSTNFSHALFHNACRRAEAIVNPTTSLTPQLQSAVTVASDPLFSCEQPWACIMSRVDV
jgi:hypothetical protein